MSLGSLLTLKVHALLKFLGHVRKPESSLSFFVASPLPSSPWHSEHLSRKIFLPLSRPSFEALPEGMLMAGFSGAPSSANCLMYAVRSATSLSLNMSAQPGIEVPFMPVHPAIELWVIPPFIFLAKSLSVGAISSNGVVFHL